MVAQVKRALLVELSDLFRREAEAVEREAYQHRGHVSDEVAIEADRLHAVADRLWERAELCFR